MDCLEEVYGFLIRAIIRSPAKYLYNGLYPCYSIYRLKDGHYLAVAAVEEKFWKSFCKIFELGELSQFDEKNFKIISQKISETRTREAREKLDGQDICVTLV